MVIRKAASGKKGRSKLKLKKETIRDLDGKGKAGKVKGGGIRRPTMVAACYAPGTQGTVW